MLAQVLKVYISNKKDCIKRHDVCGRALTRSAVTALQQHEATLRNQVPSADLSSSAHVKRGEYVVIFLPVQPSLPLVHLFKGLPRTERSSLCHWGGRPQADFE